MNSIKIYTCHHKPSAFLNASIIKPLHVGKANTYNDIGCEGDDSGDNISFKNPFYCELTAHYWVWKNESLADYVGFMHYRRHLNFAEQQNHPEDNWGVVNYPLINAEYESQFGLSDESISTCVDGYDLLLPKKWVRMPSFPVTSAMPRTTCWPSCRLRPRKAYEMLSATFQATTFHAL